MAINLKMGLNPFLKIRSHVTSAFAFFFDLCRPIPNVKYEYNHLLPHNSLLIFNVKVNDDITCGALHEYVVILSQYRHRGRYRSRSMWMNRVHKLLFAALYINTSTRYFHSWNTLSFGWGTPHLKILSWTKTHRSQWLLTTNKFFNKNCSK